MAEIRKFDPAAGNAIAQALKAAMGEPVRPNQPGGGPASRPSTPPPPAATSWISLEVSAGSDPDEESQDA
jgi:hypothetical protein